jgi:hypothetical protein
MWITAGINIAGAGARVVATAPLSLFSDRWRTANADNRRWLNAHVRGLPPAARRAVAGERGAMAR